MEAEKDVTQCRQISKTGYDVHIWESADANFSITVTVLRWIRVLIHGPLSQGEMSKPFELRDCSRIKVAIDQ